MSSVAANRGSAPAAVKPMAKGTMSRQLILRVTALVAVIAITLSALTSLVLHGILQRQLDDQLRTFTVQADRDQDRDGERPAQSRPVGRLPGFLQYGVFLTSSGVPVGLGVVQTTSGQQALTPDVATQLEAVEPGLPATVPLSGLGTYRVLTKNVNGSFLAVGLPMSSILAPVLSLATSAGLLTLLAILLAFVAARRVVTRSLLPLQRLAATANQVSNLELDRGEVNVPVRVSERDTDPRSEVGRVGLAFNHMLDNVEGALDARHRSETKVRQFVADASHELRNPLASIRGYSELTHRNRDQLPTDTGHALDRIESESARMSALVEDLLLLARLDAGPAIARTPTHLNEVVANAVSDAQVAGPDHDWSLSLPDDEVVALGDPYRLLQVVANLLANARTHTPPGTEVETALSREGRWAVVRVSDNGPGIAPDIRDHVFERFTRADASRVRRGKGGSSTGLGLAIVQAVIQAHGGTASVESVPGRTTFTLRVPLA